MRTHDRFKAPISYKEAAMGEINKVLATGEHSSGPISIELNDPVTQGGDQSIHIQTSSFRVEMNLPEFRAFAATVVDGYANLKSRKKKL